MYTIRKESVGSEAVVFGPFVSELEARHVLANAVEEAPHLVINLIRKAPAKRE